MPQQRTRPSYSWSELTLALFCSEPLQRLAVPPRLSPVAAFAEKARLGAFRPVAFFRRTSAMTEQRGLSMSIRFYPVAIAFVVACAPAQGATPSPIEAKIRSEVAEIV